MKSCICLSCLIFFRIALKSVGRLFPVHLDFSSLISLEAFWVSVECISSFLLAALLYIVHLSLLCPTLPGWWLVVDFEGGLTPFGRGICFIWGFLLGTFALLIRDGPCRRELDNCPVQIPPLCPTFYHPGRVGHNSTSLLQAGVWLTKACW